MFIKFDIPENWHFAILYLYPKPAPFNFMKEVIWDFVLGMDTSINSFFVHLLITPKPSTFLIEPTFGKNY